MQTATSTSSLSIKDILYQDFGLPKNWVSDWLLHVINKQRSFLISNNDYLLNNDEKQRFIEGIDKMQKGTPAAYLIGQQEFWSLPFKVNEHTLIPRPDTEVLVEQVLNWIEVNKNSLIKSKLASAANTPKSNFDIFDKYQLLDLGTGSGCIAISLAHELQTSHPNSWYVSAVDFSKPALEVAQHNAKLNNTHDIKFYHSDWFSALPHEVKYHVIVSNPPYIDENDCHLPKLSSEPKSALIAANNGLKDIQRIIKGARDFLVEGGLLALEHGYDQGDRARELFAQAGYESVKTIKDYGNNDRVTMGLHTS